MQLGVVISISVRWLMLVAMRPFADEVEFLYEFMSVTGEAAVMVMVCLNYFQSVAVPPAAILIGSLLIVGGNLGAQVGLLPSDSPIAHKPDCILYWRTGASDRAGPCSPIRRADAPQAHRAVRRLPMLHRDAHAAMDQVFPARFTRLFVADDTETQR